MIELPAKVPPNSYMLSFEGFHLQKWLVLRALDQHESLSCPDVDALTHATSPYVESLGGPSTGRVPKLILNFPVVYSEQEVLAEFQQCCVAEAEMPGHYTERLRLAAEDFCQMLNRQNRSVQVKKK